MNIATIIGVIVGIFVLSNATYDTTDNARIFINAHGLAIVLGGVAAATFICYPIKRVFAVFTLFFVALKREELPIGNYIQELHYLSKVAFRKGMLKLETELYGVENFFLQDGLKMLVDNSSNDEIRKIMERKIENIYTGEMAEAGIFRTMAKLSPAFGMMGTLIGLISLLQGMGSGGLETIGPAMATALVTTLYGIFLANMVFYPIAVKVESRIEERVLLMTIIMEGILLMKAKTPPDLVTDKLEAFLSAQKWISIKTRRKKKNVKKHSE